MNIIKYEKIPAQFNPWSTDYANVADFLVSNIGTERLSVIHIGSTSFQVGGKGIIDLSVLYDGSDLQMAVDHLHKLGFQDQVSDTPFPPHRPRKDGAIWFAGKKYYIHVHVIKKGSEEHIKQMAYKEYMLEHKKARLKYEESKKKIIKNGVIEQEAYGKEKSPFVKEILNNI
ncbi:GrpB family protein [Vibrio sp. TBV020]|uniref:GrpB family protein n=1 Tax=Vibrio sp. TBV020 TaxID=3137398 RepID=UPI0038CDBD9C